MKKNKIAQKTLQQGDVIAVKLEQMPAGEQKIIAQKRLVVAHGESGHSHVIEDDDATLIQIGERMLLKLEKTATIIHEEHKPITLSPGVWEIGRVQEYDYFSRMQRQVID
ncbi:MAG: hypothetical protein KGL39_56830 [Patescibacteria group bacterium]|nr:hypothetical protein [Patescibacteria group bacterium]